MAGVVTINGVNYVERYTEIPFEVTISSNLQVLPSQRLVLPGIAPFMLKALKRAVIKAGAVVNTCPFKFKFGNTDGGIWYTQLGIGGTNDRVIDSLIFGSGQFPKIVNPYILYQPAASITMEFEDLSSNSPYVIGMSFEGSLLLQQ